MRKSIAYYAGLIAILFTLGCDRDDDNKVVEEEQQTTSPALVIGKFTVDEEGNVLKSLQTVTLDNVPVDMENKELDEDKVAALFASGVKLDDVVIGNPDDESSTSQCRGGACGNGWWYPGKYLGVVGRVAVGAARVVRGLLGGGSYGYYSGYSSPYVYRGSCGYGMNCSSGYSYNNYYSSSSWGSYNSYYSSSYGRSAYDVYGVYSPCSTGYSSYSYYSQSSYNYMCSSSRSYSSYWNNNPYYSSYY